MRHGQALLISQYRQSLRNLMTVTEERLVPGLLYTQAVAGPLPKQGSVNSLLRITELRFKQEFCAPVHTSGQYYGIVLVCQYFCHEVLGMDFVGGFCALKKEYKVNISWSVKYFKYQFTHLKSLNKRLKSLKLSSSLKSSTSERMDSFEAKYFSYFSILPIYVVLQTPTPQPHPQKNPKPQPHKSPTKTPNCKNLKFCWKCQDSMFLFPIFLINKDKKDFKLFLNIKKKSY